jgi:hypothetical protein
MAVVRRGEGPSFPYAGSRLSVLTGDVLPAGSMLTAPRGTRHFFSNPFDDPARVLGIWSPATLGLAHDSYLRP